MMASKSAIPRYLLPQHGAIWRTATARSAPFPRPLSVVRYAATSTSKAKVTAGTKSTATKTTAAAKKATTTKTTISAKAPVTKAATTAKSATVTKAPAAKATVTKATAASSSTAAKTAAVPKPPAPPTPAQAPATPKAAAVPDPSKPLILEKPEKFNPPSHGSRLPRSMPKHYGGGTTFEEAQAQQERSYPGMPPPPNSWAHWFLNNRRIHMLITMGTLSSLAVYTFIQRFKATSPYVDLVPPLSEFPRHPIDYIGALFEVLRLHEEHISAETAEKRRRRVEDVAKRNDYRKAHGLEPATSSPFGGSVAAEPESEQASAAAAAPTPPVDSSVPATAPVADDHIGDERPSNTDLGLTDEGKRKKFLGVF